jgi:hypothetical protein
MRTGIWIFLCVALLFVFAILHWRQPAKSVLPSGGNRQITQTANSMTTIVQAANQIISGVPNASSPTNSSEAVNVRQSPEIIRQAMESQNIPVDFFGMVLDQDGKPLSDATVRVKVRHWNVTSPTAFGSEGQMVPLEKQTGTDGRFQLNGATGDAFDLDSVQKDGYELEPNTKRSYPAAGGSFGVPVVFRMWSTNIHEALITGEKFFHIIPDGRTYLIDLNTGTISESGNGDLKVWIKYSTKIDAGQNYNWSSDMDVIDGGLLEETDAASSMYSAPTDGYIPAFTYQQQIMTGQHGSTGVKRFYTKLKNGREYGRISINLLAPYNDAVPGLIRIQYAINPSGSQILR